MTGKTRPQHRTGQIQWHNVDHSLAIQKGPRRSAASSRAKMFVTGQPPGGGALRYALLERSSRRNNSVP